MSQTRERRASHAAHLAATEGYENDCTPSDTQVLRALRVLIAWAGAGPSAPKVYTQHDLPPDAASADAYMRRHRALRKARVAGVWARGKTLACTAEAWATDLPKTQRPRLAIVERTSVDAELDRALGIKTRAAR